MDVVNPATEEVIAQVPSAAASDLDAAVASCAFTAGGVRYRREVFASYPDQVIVVRLTADRPGSLSLTARYESPHPSARSARDGNSLTLTGQGGASQGIAGERTSR